MKVNVLGLFQVGIKSFISVSLLIVVIFGLIVFRMFFLTFVDAHEYGFVYGRFDGKITPIEHNGWVIRPPWMYDVHAIDMRPYQVSISANERILNAKLVRFNPDGIKTFIDWHGRSAGDNTNTLKEILKCYAFDRDEGKDCPFLEVVSVLAPGQTATSKPEK